MSKTFSVYSVDSEGRITLSPEYYLLTTKRKGFGEDSSDLDFSLDLPTGSVPLDEMIGTVRPEKTNKEKLREFFFGPKPAPPEPGTIQELWKQEGRCPRCGTLGRIHLSAMICPEHGPYGG